MRISHAYRRNLTQPQAVVRQVRFHRDSRLRSEFTKSGGSVALDAWKPIGPYFLPNSLAKNPGFLTAGPLAAGLSGM